MKQNTSYSQRYTCICNSEAQTFKSFPKERWQKWTNSCDSRGSREEDVKATVNMKRSLNHI